MDRGEKPPAGNGGAAPLVRGRRPRRPAGALHDADIFGSGRGTRASRADPGAAPPSAPSTSGGGFSGDFAGGRPIQTGSKNQSGDPVPETGDRRDCQRISGKRRRKSMAVSSVPGG